MTSKKGLPANFPADWDLVSQGKYWQAYNKKTKENFKRITKKECIELIAIKELLASSNH